MQIPTRKRILVVDDDEGIRTAITEVCVLIDPNCDVITSCDGVDALNTVLTRKTPDLVLLDLVMPGMDGKHFIQKIRETEYKDIPILLISASSAAPRVAEEEHVPLLMKPFDIETFNRVVLKLLKP